MRAREDVKLERLRDVPLFARCSAKELKRIASVADEIEVEAGRVLCREGRFERECFVVIDGEAEVRIDDRVVATIRAGESFGEMTLLDRHPRSATVVASTPLRAYVIDRQRFDALLEDAPPVARALLAELSHRIRDLDGIHRAAAALAST